MKQATTSVISMAVLDGPYVEKLILWNKPDGIKILRFLISIGEILILKSIMMREVKPPLPMLLQHIIFTRWFGIAKVLKHMLMIPWFTNLSMPPISLLMRSIIYYSTLLWVVI